MHSSLLTSVNDLPSLSWVLDHLTGDHFPQLSPPQGVLRFSLSDVNRCNEPCPSKKKRVPSAFPFYGRDVTVMAADEAISPCRLGGKSCFFLLAEPQCTMALPHQPTRLIIGISFCLPSLEQACNDSSGELVSIYLAVFSLTRIESIHIS
jgi:hypothetical protein